jgi:plastocyanin
MEMDAMRMTSSRMLAALTLSVLSACSGGGGGGGGGTTPQFGTISGTVTANGAGLAGVTVSISGGGSTTTSATGQFTLSNVATGARSVSVAPPAGYITAVHGADAAEVAVTAGQTSTASFQLVRGVVVNAAGTSFSPATVTVPVGATVRWVNGGGTHTVTPVNPGQPGAWASAGLGVGATFQHVFAAAGTFNYFCQPHQGMGMTGTVTVS